MLDVLAALEEGTVDARDAAVAFQGFNVLARLCKLDLEIREVAELKSDVAELKDAMGVGPRYGGRY